MKTKKIENQAKKIQAELKNSEAKYRDFYENAPVMFASVDAKTAKIIECNQTLAKLTGYKKEEIIGQPIFSMYHSDSLEAARQAFHDFKTKGFVHDKELQIKKKNGEKLDVLLSASAVRDEKGDILYSRSVWRDITEQKKAQNELLRINSLLEMNNRVSQDILLIRDRDKLLKSICERVVAYGYKFVWIGFCDEKTKRVIPVAQAGFEKGYLESIRIAFDSTKYAKGPTGMSIKLKKPQVMRFIATDPRYSPWRKQALKRGYLSSAAIPIFQEEEEEVIGSINVYSDKENVFDNKEVSLLEELARDISIALRGIEAEKKREEVEKQLMESEVKYRELFENNPDGVAIADIKTKKFVFVNSTICKMLGYSKKELLKLGVENIHPKDSLKFAISEFQALASGDKTLAKDIPCLRKDGTILYCDINSTNFTIEGKKCNVGVFRDITQRRQAEQKLQLSEFHLKEAQRIARIGNWSVKLKDNTIIWSDEMYHIYGVAKEKFPHTLAAFTRLIFPDDRHIMKRWVKLSIGKFKPKAIDFRIILSDGSIRWIRGDGELITDKNGRPVRMVGTAQDITERKQAEERLCISEKRFFNAFKVSPAGLTITRIADGKFIDANDAFCKMFEFNRDEVVGHTSLELNILSKEERRKLIELQLETRGLHNAELESRSKSGKLITILFSSKPMELEGEACHVTTMIDITERKLIADALQESERKLSTLIANLPGFVYRCKNDKYWTTEFVSKGCFALTGYQPSDLIGNKKLAYVDIIVAEDRKRVWNNIQTALKAKQPFQTEYRIKTAGGDIKYIWEQGRGIWDDKGELLVLEGFVTDISQRKKAEEKIQALLATLKDKNERLSGLINNIADEIWFTDAQGKFTLANPAALREFGSKAADGVKVEKLAKSLEVLRPDGSRRPIKESPPLRALAGKTVRNQEEIVRTPATGELRHRQVSSAPVRDLKGKIIGAVSVVRDISELKKAAEKEKAYVKELEKQKLALEQKNIALSEMIQQIEIEKNKLKGQIATNVEELALPIVQKLRIKGASKKYTRVLEQNLKDLVSSFGLKAAEKIAKLSPKETEICNLIKSGLSSKEISNFLNTSYQTIEKHRKNIRKKLGISQKEINLTTFLQNL